MTFLVGDPTIVSLYTLNNHLEIAWGGALTYCRCNVNLLGHGERGNSHFWTEVESSRKFTHFMGPESQLYAPTEKTDMNPRKNGGLEDDFPFHLGDF